MYETSACTPCVVHTTAWYTEVVFNVHCIDSNSLYLHIKQIFTVFCIEYIIYLHMVLLACIRLLQIIFFKVNLVCICHTLCCNSGLLDGHFVWSPLFPVVA